MPVIVGVHNHESSEEKVAEGKSSDETSGRVSNRKTSPDINQSTSQRQEGLKNIFKNYLKNKSINEPACPDNLQVNFHDFICYSFDMFHSTIPETL